MKVVMIPSGFKECLHAGEVGIAMERGARRYNNQIDVEILPMIDGGEGFAKAITNIKGGQLIYKEVTGPVGEKVLGHFGIFEEDGKRTAVIEMAAVSGLHLVPKQQRNPLKTTSFGVGELIAYAMDLHINQLLIGCGDSGTSDGGTGMAQALGVQFFNDNHQLITIEGGGDLRRIAFMDTNKLDKRLRHLQIDVACNWKNVLCGNQGVARVFGPQKGATRRQVELLATGLEHYAEVIQSHMHVDVRTMPGSGASGGLGAGLIAFAGATLHERFTLIRDFIDMEQAIASADVVFSAEGSLDFQTPNGKVPAEVARIARKYDVPVVIIAGTIGKGATANYRAGIHAYTSITQKPIALNEALELAPKWIEDSVESILRQIEIGTKLAKRKDVIHVKGNGRAFQKQ
ncbi:glycerate kinase [Agaribacter marinus]|uniref:Glycerate kinase n=1 Tax=Virgibacillus salarius TaxID=447199 RepID=A0A941DT82_9BACI|nr:glycerate kinase [Virgibacillus salarius]MBR7794952.1 glycerate kinase [Virgibacillus salarius]NAZ07672.1 glycerate kinase [Agaribacter marinus]